MNLVIDVGNTRVKYAFFDGNELKESGFETALLVEKLRTLKRSGIHVDSLLSGSGKVDAVIEREIAELSDSCLVADSLMDLPLALGYDTPETLGFDRIAICAGAMILFPGNHLLVIDSGTAVTFNYVTETGIFVGGNISPGMETRFKALNQFTARLPYVEARKEYGGIGKNTPDAILNGVMNGLLFEIRGYIDDFIMQYPNGKVLVTGGNTPFLEQKMPEAVHFNKYLGLIGLNYILEHHKKANK